VGQSPRSWRAGGHGRLRKDSIEKRAISDRWLDKA
jgi:hypothetical protein